MNTIGCKVIKVSMIFVDSVKYFLKRLQSYGSYEVAQGTTIMSSSKKYRRLQSCIGYDDFADSEKIFLQQGCKVTEVTGLHRAPPLCHLLRNTEGCKVASVTMILQILKKYFFKVAGLQGYGATKSQIYPYILTLLNRQREKSRKS